jgi:oxepin-CoA hydrolase/3-oxo-5,6-dehydrosuberyl-CoA semialdehyde dehydrogenase
VRVVRNFLKGQWIEGSGTGTVLTNATTGLPIASASSAGLDLGDALAYARRVGGPDLRGLTFAQRGDLLKNLSETLHGARDELIELARENSGNTRSDAKFDIDGAAGTLAYYSALGRKLGDQTWLADGSAEPILRSPRFVGQHLLVPRRGVAIHINAFNFPAWGLCEKAADALAGVPILTKPATATTLVAERVVALWHAAGILPPGSVSLLCGAAGDLLDHVGPQDCIAFTGSSETGRAVRGHPAVLRHAVPVNIEADSLNAAILGPDVEPGTETFEMFVADVARDITQKAGQKCTAIRRILVPEALSEAAIDAIRERLELAAVGDPHARATTVGPLATAAQQRDIQAGISRLGEVATCVWEATSAPEAGWYVAPRLFRAEGGAAASFVHDHEVFGPVATVLPWPGDATTAIEIVARGGGSLVTSIYSDDVEWARELLFGVAPWNGRIVWGSRKVHDQGAGPGTVFPAFTHGGPGKAGGGEELGGERGLQFYLHRIAVQGDRGLLERALGSKSDSV